jgi:ABC-type multidrug transport system fused ATPase/permease subunit
MESGLATSRRGTLVQSATQFQNSLSGLDRVLDILAESREMSASPSSIKADRRLIKGDVTFEHVTFSYPGAETPALNDITLKVSAGQTVALVGPSGVGKTTLSNLVARFYDPTSGRITLDGRDLRDYDVESFRSLLGIVEQDVFLFDGTIFDNIAYSRRDATPADVRAAGRNCVCNALLVNVDLAQVRPGRGQELPLVTCGDDVREISRFAKASAKSYSASDVIDRLMSLEAGCRGACKPANVHR